MRAFIAIELPKKIRDHLSEIQNRLKASGADVKWVEPGNIHLTLKFLGEIDGDTKAKVMAALSGIAAQKDPFAARLSSIGAFPGIQSPRVIWVGLYQGDGSVREIARDIEAELEKIGIPREEREFSSHITLGRTRSSRNRSELVKLLKLPEGQKEDLEFDVTKISFLKSTLTPKGPVYEVLQEAYLQKGI